MSKGKWYHQKEKEYSYVLEWVYQGQSRQEAHLGSSENTYGMKEEEKYNTRKMQVKHMPRILYFKSAYSWNIQVSNLSICPTVHNCIMVTFSQD